MTDKVKPTLENLIDLYGVPDPSVVGKLPKITCPKCSKAKGVCEEHTKMRCDRKTQPRRTDGWCGNYMTERHIHIDYVGHAELTRILHEIDVDWEWAPLGYNPDGTPAVTVANGEASMWGKLTLLGKTRIGVGTCDSDKHDREKELIGDLLRNVAMRFGIALKLWSKSEWEAPAEDLPVVAPEVERTGPTHPIVSDEEKAEAAAVIDPNEHPDHALVAKYGSQARTMRAAKDLALASDDATMVPRKFADILENPVLLKALLDAS